MRVVQNAFNFEVDIFFCKGVFEQLSRHVIHHMVSVLDSSHDTLRYLPGLPASKVPLLTLNEFLTASFLHYTL